jgi:hypothetical protein
MEIEKVNLVTPELSLELWSIIFQALDWSSILAIEQVSVEFHTLTSEVIPFLTTWLI